MDNVTSEKILELYNQGLGNREIQRELNLANGAVSYWLKKNKLVTNRARGKPPIPVDEHNSLCSKCGVVTPNDKFPWVTNSIDGRKLSYCMQCRYQQVRKSAGSNPTSYWRSAQSRLKNNRRGLEYNLPTGYLEQVWYKQDGKCFYSDIPLEISWTEGTNNWTPSIDRVNVSKGYVVDNIVICGNRINSIKRDMTFEEMKAWTPDWYQRLVSGGFINGNN